MNADKKQKFKEWALANSVFRGQKGEEKPGQRPHEVVMEGKSDSGALKI